MPMSDGSMARSARGGHFSYAARRAGALSNMGRSRRERALETEYKKIPPPVENTGDGTSGQLLGAAVIKVVCRQLSADRCRIGIEQHGEETAELCLHLIACKVENVAVRQRFLCDSGRGNNAAVGNDIRSVVGGIYIVDRSMIFLEELFPQPRDTPPQTLRGRQRSPGAGSTRRRQRLPTRS